MPRFFTNTNILDAATTQYADYQEKHNAVVAALWRVKEELIHKPHDSILLESERRLEECLARNQSHTVLENMEARIKQLEGNFQRRI